MTDDVDTQFSGDESDIDKDFVPVTLYESDERSSDESVPEKNCRTKKVKLVKKTLVFEDKNERSKYVCKEKSTRNANVKPHDKHSVGLESEEDKSNQPSTSTSGDDREPNDRLQKKKNQTLPFIILDLYSDTRKWKRQ